VASPGPGSRVAGYLIEARLGEGGSGTVFRARHEASGQVVALKVISEHLTGDRGVRDRFIREAKELRALEHRHVIPIHDAGTADGVLYIATRYVADGDLADLLYRNGGPLPPARVAALIEQVASALDMVHAADRVHRDVKPGNILVEVLPGPRDHAYLSDLGLIKVMGATQLTQTGAWAGGTPDYNAPEQVRNVELDGRADQYSLACVAFHLLTGRVPYSNSNPILAQGAHVHAPVPSALDINPALPPAAGQVLQRAMAKEPGDRYGSCGEFAANLRTALAPPAYTPTWTPDHPPTRAPRPTSGQPGPTWGPQPGPTSEPQPEPTSGPQPPEPWPEHFPEQRRPRRKRPIAVGTAVAVAVAAVIVVATTLDHPGGGVAGGAVGSNAASGKASLRWSYTTGMNLAADQEDATSSSPTVVDGTVYVGGNDGNAYAFNAATGHLDWSTVTASADSGPTVADGTVYIGTAGGMYALNAANGHSRWSYGSGSAGSSPVVADGTVYFVDANGNVHALNAATGKSRWSHSIGYAGTGLAVADGLVYVSSIGDIGYVYALDAATGGLSWTFKTEDARESTPTVVNGTVYVGCGNGPGSNGTVFAIDAATGKSRWSYPTGNGTPFGAGGGVESSPTVAGDIVYVGSDNGTVYALDTASGHLDWSYTTPTGSSVVSTPAVVGGTVYIGSEDNRVYALSAATGDLVWSYPTGNVIVSNPAAAGGIVYAASDDGKLYALATVKLWLSRHPAVAGHLGGRRPRRVGRLRPPVRDEHHAGRHQLEAGERKRREHVGVPRHHRHPGLPVGARPAFDLHPVVLGSQLRGDEVGTGGQGVEQRRDDRRGIIGILKEVHDRDEEQRDRLAEVKRLPHHRRRQDLLRAADVRLHVRGAPLRRRGQQRPGVREDEGVVVDVHDMRGRRDGLRHLMHVVGRRQPRP
jgi:outer membrane protein assembly factor BamB/serine/threonine protein kinase